MLIARINFNLGFIDHESKPRCTKIFFLRELKYLWLISLWTTVMVAFADLKHLFTIKESFGNLVSLILCCYMEGKSCGEYQYVTCFDLISILLF